MTGSQSPHRIWCCDPVGADKSATTHAAAVHNHFVSGVLRSDIGETLGPSSHSRAQNQVQPQTEGHTGPMGRIRRHHRAEPVDCQPKRQRATRNHLSRGCAPGCPRPLRQISTTTWFRMARPRGGSGIRAEADAGQVRGITASGLGRARVSSRLPGVSFLETGEAPNASMEMP